MSHDALTARTTGAGIDGRATSAGGEGCENSGPDVVAVVGPTATGKSELAVRLARELDGEVVSVDALQVYRGLDIGTAKVDAATRRGVPHHCLDLVEPEDAFDAGSYAREARRAIAGIHRRGRLPVLAGGSGFYLKAVVDGLAPLPQQEPDWRRVLEGVEERRGPGHLFRMLQRLDPEWAGQVGEADRQRILRGLEVTLRVGEPFSELLDRRDRDRAPYRVIWVGIDRPRKALRRRIARRVDAMLEAGWLDEVRRLLESGVSREAPGLEAIGYRELAATLAGEMTLEEARETVVVATRRYARKQRTWFRNQTPARWFLLDGRDVGDIVDPVLEHVRRELTVRRSP